MAGPMMPAIHPMDVIEHPDRYSIVAGEWKGLCKCRWFLAHRHCQLDVPISLWPAAIQLPAPCHQPIRQAPAWF
jgi:hypothetical protein